MTDSPAPKLATIEPSELMLMLSIMPAAEPFWLIEEVSDSEAKLVSVDTLLASSTFQLTAALVAPFCHVGMVKLRLAGAAPLIWLRAPLALKVSVPAEP